MIDSRTEYVDGLLRKYEPTCKFMHARPTFIGMGVAPSHEARFIHFEICWTFNSAVAEFVSSISRPGDRYCADYDLGT